jgi:cytosine/adenosine deaminase-related metal-dependent hydrolase
VHQFSDFTNFPPELIYNNTLASAAEMMLSGTTAVLDHFWMAQGLTLHGLDAVMQAYRDAGIRAAVAPMLEDSDRILHWTARYAPELLELHQEDNHRDAEQLLALMRQFLHNWQGQPGGRLQPLLGPGGLQWCSDPLLSGCRDLAEEFGAGFHIHLNETALQARVCKDVYRESAVEHLFRLNVLNSVSSLAHVVWVDSSDINLLADCQVTVIHNPISNLKLGSGIAPVMNMLQAGVTVSLGTDGPASNDNQNMFAVMKTTGLIHSPAVSTEKRWISAREVFDMASLKAARAIGADESIGKIASGMHADLTFLVFDPLLQISNADLMTFLVYTETGDAVRHVMVDGEWVVLDRECVRFSLRNIRENLINQAASFFASHPRDTTTIARAVAIWKSALDRCNTPGDRTP